MHKIIFLDTNIFLHYQPFDQINWLEIVEAESATIVVPPITIRELSKHKDSHPRTRIKKRAGETIKRLLGLLELGASAKLAEGISVTFEDRDPIIDFATHQLNINIQDDQLIASVLMNRLEAPDEHVVLVTSDLGLTLVIKASRQDINTQKMPESFRLADEPDPNETKVKQLEQEIRELNSRTPKLSLVYEDGKQHAPINLPQPVLLEKSEIEEKINGIIGKLPKRKKGGLQDEADSSQNALERLSVLAAMTPMTIIPQEEIERYNSEIEKFIPAYTKFILRELEFENLKRRTIRLDIALSNDGTSPAEDIDIYLHFPDGFQLVEEEELPDPPKPPKPPVEPMTGMQRVANSLNYSQLIPPSIFINPPDTLLRSPQNVSSPNIRRVNSYEVHVHVQKIKHNLQVPLDPLFVIFERFESASSFNIDYRILAANIPHEVTGKLHIIIQKDSPK
ncbi:MAG: hypothetical protein HYZ26_06395 [Chloroflexi bacterium]|nr:hypothetical protein [Chloroflexota bacterium]